VIRILDGPAAGQVLALRRAPLYLRLVRTVGGDWDALDQREDQCSADELPHAYERIGEASTVHVRMSRGSGWYQVAEYRAIVDQPDEATMRSNQRWRDWAVDRFDRTSSGTVPGK
jgi:hypothetical protein